MNKLLTATLLLVAGAASNALAQCRSCETAPKPECVKEVTVQKRTCPEKHVMYSCPDGYHEASKKKAENGNKKKGKGQSY